MIQNNNAILIINGIKISIQFIKNKANIFRKNE